MHNKSIKAFSKKVWKPLRHTPIHRTIFPRKFHAICVGTPKSGTHSIANLFNENFRAAHEPDAPLAIPALISDSEPLNLRKFLKERDKKLWLEMESSHYLMLAIDQLVSLFPDLKVVLVICDCYSWAQSQVNQLVRTPNNSDTRHWFSLGNVYFKDPLDSFPDEEKNILKFDKYDRLCPLENLFQFWAHYNSLVINTVPPERLLILKTSNLKSSSTVLASFLGISADSLPRERSYSGQAKNYDFDLFTEVDPKYSGSRWCEVRAEAYNPYPARLMLYFILSGTAIY